MCIQRHIPKCLQQHFHIGLQWKYASIIEQEINCIVNGSLYRNKNNSIIATRNNFYEFQTKCTKEARYRTHDCIEFKLEKQQILQPRNHDSGYLLDRRCKNLSMDLEELLAQLCSLCKLSLGCRYKLCTFVLCYVKLQYLKFF